MKSYTRALLGCATVTLAFHVQAATYNDSTGDILPTASIMDITSVEVNSTTTDLIFKINLAGDPVATDWGKYMVALNTTAGGDSSGNGWARPISMSGMDYWLGSWVDGSMGAQLWNYTGTWNGPTSISISKDSSSVTLQLPFASLGLGAGSSFIFDVFSSGGGGGDSAIDALANPAQSVANWGDAYGSQSTLSFTIPQVPEPTSLAFLGLGSLLLINRIRRR